MTSAPPPPSPIASKRVAIAGGAAAALVLVVTLGLAAGRDGLVRGALALKLGRPVSFAQLQASPGRDGLHVVFTDLVLGQPKAFGAGDLARIGSLDLDLHVAPLLVGKLEAPRIAVAHARLDLRRKGPGDDNWTFGKGGASSFLAATRTLSIADTRVTMDDPQRHLQLDAAVTNDPADAALPLHLDGGGVLNGAPFKVAARGGPLNARKPDAPHAFRADMLDGRTRVRIVGTAHKPFDFSGFDVDMTAAGPDAADLVYLFNFLAPTSPPFQIAGHIHKVGKRLEATGLHGMLGEADLGGTVVSVHDGPRRRVEATMHSRRMTAAQLKLMLAAPPPHMTTRDTPGGGGSPTGGGSGKASGRLFSDKPFSVARLQKDDVRVTYSADRVDGYPAPVTDLSLRLDITQQGVSLAPVRFATASGRVDAAFALETAARPPRVKVKLTARNLRLSSLTGGKGGVSGALDADLDATGSGASASAAAAAAQGRASVRVAGGALPGKDAAALSGDLFGLIGSALGGGKAPLRCAVADFAIDHGVARAQRLEIAAGSGKALGVGRIDLADETIALRLRASDAGPKPAVQLKAPIYVTGPIAHPKVDAQLSKATLSLGGLFDALAKPFKAPAPAPPPPGC